MISIDHEKKTILLTVNTKHLFKSICRQALIGKENIIFFFTYTLASTLNLHIKYFIINTSNTYLIQYLNVCFLRQITTKNTNLQSFGTDLK